MCGKQILDVTYYRQSGGCDERSKRQKVRTGCKLIVGFAAPTQPFSVERPVVIAPPRPLLQLETEADEPGADDSEPAQDRCGPLNCCWPRIH